MNKTLRNTLCASTAAFGLLAFGHAHAQTVINSGGSTLASPTYEGQFGFFDNTNPNDDFVDGYLPSGSGAAQTAVLTNVINAAGGATPFEFGASDATISATQLSTYDADAASLGYGAAVDGKLIEVPAMGVPITMALNFSGVTANGAVTLNDTQICGIFSGMITNTASLSGSGLPANTPIGVAYRSDNSGTSFLFTQHLAAVCTKGTNSAVAFFATQNFSSVFTSVGQTVPANFKGGTGSPGVQNNIAGTASTIGYLSPDYTQEAAQPYAPTSGTAPFVAQLTNSTNGTNYLPTPTNVAAALATGTPVTNPTVNPAGTANNTADPNSFVPVAANPATGYPIVGYTTFLMLQCYADPNVAAAIKAYVSDVYSVTIYRNAETSSGFAPLPTALAGTIRSTYLGSVTTSTTNDINGTGVGECASLAGR